MDELFTKVTARSASIMGQPDAFVISTLLVLMWAISRPFLHYSDTWQLVINAATTVLTFLAVFLIQNSQNRDGAAMQAKLDEILGHSTSRVEFVGIEHLTDRPICEVWTALESDIKEGDDKDRTVGGTVEGLLNRY